MIKSISGNEAVAVAALHSGATVITGYPGTPSSEAVGSLWGKAPSGVTVQWSINEKVALEIAAAAAWAGRRGMCCMKMSGLNVAYDSLVSIAYSGCTGALVVYVCDDPGVSAGMPEQDVRGFAKMTDMPVIDLATVEESYTLTRYAFELSERIQSPVMLRSVTSVALSHATANIPDAPLIQPREPELIKDINKYTKAGAAICMRQHADLIERLALAQKLMHVDGLNTLNIVEGADCGMALAGVAAEYYNEGLEIAKKYADIGEISTLVVRASVPLPKEEVNALISSCKRIAVIEENEPYLEHGVMVEAQKAQSRVRIFGKEDGSLSRIGSFDAITVAKAILKLFGHELPGELINTGSPERLCARRPIGVCAGCPHRGVFIAINDAVKKLGYKKDEVMVTGDRGCTILGMSPPFETLWTEVSMGASSPMAQGFVHAGVKTPVISTIGDSTFLHGGIPGLINCVQHQTPVLTIIMDNGWTGMTGMQVNAGTASEYQPSGSRVDIANIVRALGVEQFRIADPYDLPAITKDIYELLQLGGVKVLLARRECAIQAGRRKVKYGAVHIDETKCTRCKACILKSGCPALVFDGSRVSVDRAQCNGCGVCQSLCAFSAIVKEDV